MKLYGKCVVQAHASMITKAENGKYPLAPISSHTALPLTAWKEKLEYLWTARMTRTLCRYENLMLGSRETM